MHVYKSGEDFIIFIAQERKTMHCLLMLTPSSIKPMIWEGGGGGEKEA